MATLITDPKMFPDSAGPDLEVISRLGFTVYGFDYEHPLVDRSRRVQIRDEKHLAPSSEVTKYAAAYKRGDKLPPIIVTRDDVLVDGHTRTEGRKRAGYPDIPTIILDVFSERATDGQKRRLHTLGAGVNLRHGKTIDRKEIADAVEQLGEDRSYDAKRIAALLSLPENTVSAILAEKRAKDRAELGGVHVNGSVPVSLLRKLGQASDKLNDGPFLGLMRLTLDAGLTMSELAGLLARVKGAGSDTAAMALIEAETEARKEQIEEYRARGKARTSHAVQLRQRLGFITGFAGGPSELAEYSPNFADQHREMITHSITILQRVLDIQSGVSGGGNA